MLGEAGDPAFVTVEHDIDVSPLFDLDFLLIQNGLYAFIDLTYVALQLIKAIVMLGEVRIYLVEAPVYSSELLQYLLLELIIIHMPHIMCCHATNCKIE